MLYCVGFIVSGGEGRVRLRSSLGSSPWPRLGKPSFKFNHKLDGAAAGDN